MFINYDTGTGLTRPLITYFSIFRKKITKLIPRIEINALPERKFYMIELFTSKIDEKWP